MVAFKVKLHIHPGIKIRVWYKDEFLCPPKADIIKQVKDKRRIMFFDPPRVSF